MKDARLRLKWKVELLSYLRPFREIVSKPVHKLICEVSHGILSSGSLKISEIGRALKEEMDLHHTTKRLSRMLSKHELWPAIDSAVLSRMSRHLDKQMVLAIDPGDLDRRHGVHCEAVQRLRDGSTGEIIAGYPLISVVARNGQSGKTVPLLLKATAYPSDSYHSENNEIISAMSRVRQEVGNDHLWVIDRGGDHSRLWKHWLKHEYQVLVRVTKQRHWLWRNHALNAQAIAKQLPCKHQCSMRRGGGDKVKFGMTTVKIASAPDQPLTMIVIRHGRKEPMVLVSTRRAYGRRQGMALIHAYMDRWAVEEGYRFSKQGFGLEGVMARKLSTIKNLVAMMLLAWSFLVEQEPYACELKERGKADKLKSSRAKKKRRETPKSPRFPYYTILKGWQILFAQGKNAITHWLRKPKQPTPQKQPTLPGLLLPTVWE